MVVTLGIKVTTQSYTMYMHYPLQHIHVYWSYSSLFLFLDYLLVVPLTEDIDVE